MVLVINNDTIKKELLETVRDSKGVKLYEDCDSPIEAYCTEEATKAFKDAGIDLSTLSKEQMFSMINTLWNTLSSVAVREKIIGAAASVLNEEHLLTDR